MKSAVFPIILATWFAYQYTPKVPSFYRVSTSVAGVRNLLNLPQAEIDACIDAYEYMVNGTAEFSNGSNTKEATVTETEHVRSYYTVVNEVLAIADIEKMYIPPLVIAKEGLFANQMQWERDVFDTMGVSNDSKILDIGCGRGRISHHAATHTGAHVSGFNIDSAQIENAIEYAAHTGMSEQLDFKQGDHHNPFAYPSNSFDGSYSFQAVWPFFKEHELDSVSQEMFRVLKPGAVYSCSEYLLTPHFDRGNEEHMALHRLFLPTLAATQSNYPSDVTEALERAGFEIVLSAPSVGPAWPLTDQKTDLFLFMRSIILHLNSAGLMPYWVVTLVNNLLKGGVAWADAEKMKIADLNWRIIARKPEL